MTSPNPALLLPYSLEHTPATAAQPGAVALNRVRLTIGDDPEGRTAWPVRCGRIAVDLPTAHGAAARTGEPVILRTRLELERGPGRGRQWLVETTTTDPTVTTLTLSPAEPASFDGTWTLTLTLDISTPLGTQSRITEDTARGESSPQRRAGTAALTVMPLAN
ncbi:hypothetical protein E6W39_10975 [Kitasatospora acidiphila]|uniref:Uncharacterized protein n=1 Tax=Kitasatospora acidiphila TaxID=2567942 RepID=A0A540W145_9ACTN|nr:hypothetical protein [Kitasatospora acidiphila]TQF02687.1 hypothetical protein E6W39_10975 [Kitasatospora acidiphila]